MVTSCNFLAARQLKLCATQSCNISIRLVQPNSGFLTPCTPEVAFPRWNLRRIV